MSQMFQSFVDLRIRWKYFVAHFIFEREHLWCSWQRFKENQFHETQCIDKICQKLFTSYLREFSIWKDGKSYNVVVYFEDQNNNCKRRLFINISKFKFLIRVN